MIVSRLFASCAIVVLACAPGAQAQDLRNEGIKNFVYGMDFGTASGELIQYYLGVARHCVATVGSDPAVLPEIATLVGELAPPNSEKAEKLRAYGESGMLGDPTGAVPALPIREIAAVKGVDVAAVCADVVSVLRGEVKSYREFCAIKPESPRVICPDTRRLYRVLP